MKDSHLGQLLLEEEESGSSVPEWSLPFIELLHSDELFDVDPIVHESLNAK